MSTPSFSLESISDNGEPHPFLPASTKPPVILYSEFPEILDNTAREQFFTCPQKFFRSSIQKLGPLYLSEHLMFGGAFAAGLEHMRKAFYDEGHNPADALNLGIIAAVKYYGDFEPREDSPKTAENLIMALDYYSEAYPLATDYIRPILLSSGKHAIEFTFAIPLEIKHPVTGNPLIYAGRFDMLADYNGAHFLVDDKTASRLGPTWKVQWKNNSQFTGYSWAAQAYGKPVAGAIVRGQSILKNGFGHEEDIVYRPQWMIDRWYEQLLRDIGKMIKCWEENYYDYAIGTACAAYSGCTFLKLCTSPRPNDWIQTEYQQHSWNPLFKDPELIKENI